jgi:DNA-directed RNA polymerase subunit alpha
LKNGKTGGMPHVMAVATATNYGRFVIGPLEEGVGTPLGNALRRILLSSLPGSAVTSIRIQNIYHEFSCVPNVREDVTEIVLNVKNIRLRSYSDRPVRLQLSKQGAGQVRAGDIDLPANVELVNPDLVLANLDGDDSSIEMELTVERGRGYVSFEAREGVAIGTIPVDAIFSPIPKVNYVVEPASLDLLTSAEEDENAPELDPSMVEGRDQVVIEIWTDGTIDPGEALSMSAQYLAQHSTLIATFNRVVPAAVGRDLPGINIPPHLFEMSVEDLNLSMRTYNCLKRSGITKVGQVLTKDRKELLGLRNFGEKSYDELYDALSSRDLIPEGSPLYISHGAAPDEEGAEADGESDGLDDVDMDDMDDMDADDAGDDDDDYDDIDADDLLVQMPVGDVSVDGAGSAAETGEIVEEAGVSEGSVEMAAGIFVDGVPSHGEIEMPSDAAMTAATGEIDNDIEGLETASPARPKARSKKSAAKTDD